MMIIIITITTIIMATAKHRQLTELQMSGYVFNSFV